MSAITQVPFYPSDWLAGTRGMTAAQMGVYITLITMMYERAGPIRCDDLPKLARLCGTSASAMKGLLDDLISDGKIARDGDLLSNRRTMLEIENVMAKSEVARDKANARWQKKPEKSMPEECTGITPAMQAISHKPVDTTSSLCSDVERVNAPKSRKSKIDCTADLIALGCPESLISEWKAVRKAKDAGPITETVVEALQREADQAGVTVREAVRLSVENGWRGFKASWLQNQVAPMNARDGPGYRQPSLRGSAAIAAALHRISNDEPDNSAIPSRVAGFLPSR